MRVSFPILVLLAMLPRAFAQEPLTSEKLWSLKRVSGGEVSPDSRWVLYSVRSWSLKDNKGDSDLWIVPLAGPAGAAQQVTSGPTSESDAQWVKTKGGMKVFCVAKKGDTPQVWAIDVAGGPWSQVTDVKGGVTSLKVSPDGSHIAYTADVKLDQTVQDLYPDLPKADARIIDSLYFRHWDEWHDFAYSHVFVAPVGADGKAGPATDVMEGLRTDCPEPPFGDASHYDWSPDGRMIAWNMKLVANPAQSTDTNVYVRDVSAGAEPRTQCLTTGMGGYDQQPVWSPDGKRLAFSSMERAGFEADRWRLMVWDRDTDQIRELLGGSELSAHDLRWTPDGSALWFGSEVRGTEQVFRIDAGEGEAEPVAVTAGKANWSLGGVSPDGKTLVLSRQDMIRPPELYAMPAEGGERRALTAVNDAAYTGLKLAEVTERSVRATDGKSIQCWVILPPGFDPKQRYPMITYCQGGPQSQIGQSFSWRWNFHLMAANGYVVLAPNRRGLPGFGREWNDSISGDWGGQAMRDLLAATDDMLTEPWIDAQKTAAVGASFGGYSVYWLMGHAEDRFRCMIAHCGVFNLESMYGSTEELWFVNWDLGGPYFASDGARALYDSFSPHRFAGNWKTPLLVIHGEKDFRVPVTQGMEAFTAAQVKGVPSRFLYFPNEGHWISTPQNSVLWNRVFFDWLARWCK